MELFKLLITLVFFFFSDLLSAAVSESNSRKAPSPPPQAEPEKEKKLSPTREGLFRMCVSLTFCTENFVTYVEKEESEDSGAENAENTILAPVDTQSPLFIKDLELLMKSFPQVCLHLLVF